MFRSIRCLACTVMLIGVFVETSCSAEANRKLGEYRELRDQRGRPIQARVLNVRGDKVTIQRRSAGR
jgi:hypothetical protein